MGAIGRKLYYNKFTGEVLVDTGERSGAVRETTTEEDLRTYKVLSERNPETIGMIQLEYGQYRQDFLKCNGYRVNPSTQEIEFSYPNPNEPEPQEPTYQKPLTEEIADIKQSIAELTIILGGGA